jgi:hypothetical protein
VEGSQGRHFLALSQDRLGGDDALQAHHDLGILEGSGPRPHVDVREAAVILGLVPEGVLECLLQEEVEAGLEVLALTWRPEVVDQVVA